jgi:hypothetical protein
MGTLLAKPKLKGRGREGGYGEVVDAQKAGDLFVVLYHSVPRSGSPSEDAQNKRMAHMAVVVDVEGMSTNERIHGTQIRTS